MPEEKHHQVIPLGDGNFVVVTVHVRSKVVSADTLRDMGLSPPPPEVPWAPESPPRVVHAAERAEVLKHWTEQLGGYDARLSQSVAPLIREFDVAGLKEAIDQLAGLGFRKKAVSHKHEEFLRVLRQMRERRRGGTP